MMFAAVAFIQDKKFFSSAPKEAVEAIRPRDKELFPGASEEQVLSAARRAQCDELLGRLPDGINTKAGDGGKQLSGGEKQRISIARCILKDAPIVILDEATASVDADNERAIQEAVSELCRNKTLLVIAHRLRTIRDADQILVVSDGRIAERGDHEGLCAQRTVCADGPAAGVISVNTLRQSIILNQAACG
ncbi:MAG: ATP-binding cassette domain-containing protein [Lachnospiraceae bacterium]|nr:ATP-binding cassette domain-containing protein [Lachnospiraceae bacterium]